MGHSFGLLDFSTGRRYSVLALGLAAATIFPYSHAVAQDASPAPKEETSEVQFVQSPKQGQSTPATITLKDALDRARKLDPTVVGAMYDAKSAHEDRLQARNAMLPQVNGTLAYLGTQGNGGKVSDGRFVTNDGIHVYRAWGVFKQDLSPALMMGTAYTRAKAAEALASAPSQRLPAAGWA